MPATLPSRPRPIRLFIACALALLSLMAPPTRPAEASPTGHGAVITSGPAEGAVVEDDAATFTFQDPPDFHDLACHLDGLELDDCPSPLVLTGLANGPHELVVQAVAREDAGPTIVGSDSRNWVVAAADRPTDADADADGDGVRSVDDACPDTPEALDAVVLGCAPLQLVHDPSPLLASPRQAIAAVTDLIGDEPLYGRSSSRAVKQLATASRLLDHVERDLRAGRPCTVVKHAHTAARATSRGRDAHATHLARSLIPGDVTRATQLVEAATAMVETDPETALQHAATSNLTWRRRTSPCRRWPSDGSGRNEPCRWRPKHAPSSAGRR